MPCTSTTRGAPGASAAQYTAARSPPATGTRISSGTRMSSVLVTSPPCPAGREGGRGTVHMVGLRPPPRLQLLDGEGDQEAERGDQPGPGAGLLESLGDHRVRDHGED